VARYALNDVEKRLLDYLEGNSYFAELYSYNGSSSPESATSFEKAQNCVLAPVSSPTFGFFALNCNGVWSQVDNIKILENQLKGKLSISGLTYVSGYYNDNPISIIYPNMELNQDSFDNNFYLLDRVFIQTKETDKNTASFTQDLIRLQRLYDNQA
jgi:hypothetical protein